MQTDKIAWLAGIIDGEGCFSIFKRKNKSSNGNVIITPSASITITNSNKAILDECSSILAKLKVISWFKSVKSINKGERQVRRLDIRNYKSIVQLINAVLPYLIGKKEQALLVREFAIKASRRVGFRATQERAEYPEKISKLNRLSQSYP